MEPKLLWRKQKRDTVAEPLKILKYSFYSAIATKSSFFFLVEVVHATPFLFFKPLIKAPPFLENLS